MKKKTGLVQKHLTELFAWMLGAVKKCIVEMEKGTYNSYVSANLNVFERTGIINRKDYWDVFPEYRDNYFQNITKQEIDRFVTLITEQNDDPVGEYLESMTANKFYAFCNMGYIANNYSGSDKLTAKEMYYNRTAFATYHLAERNRAIFGRKKLKIFLVLT